MNDSEVVGNGLKTIYYKRSRRETTTVDKSTNEVGRIILTHNYVVKRQAGTRVYTSILFHVLHQIFSTMKSSLEVYLENQIIQIKKDNWSFNINASFFPHRSLPNSMSKAYDILQG